MPHIVEPCLRQAEYQCRRALARGLSRMEPVSQEQLKTNSGDDAPFARWIAARTGDGHILFCYNFSESFETGIARALHSFDPTVLVSVSNDKR